MHNNDIKIFSVSEITTNIKALLKANYSSIYIKGEISNLKESSLKHVFFNIKDEKALINCVIFENDLRKIKFKLEDGIKVMVLGSISVFEKRGTYNLIIKDVMPEGKGALQLAFEQLKAKLEKEGLFSQENKKPIPAYPQRIGIVTGLNTAALRDILNVINRRHPSIHLQIYPAVMQGENSAKTIVKGIKVFNEFFTVDVMIIARGGGSIEDLWSFNEEIVARAIFESKIPVITGVGHEVDYTIADFVSDKRAPTPSAAAELVLKDEEEIKKNVWQLQNKLDGFIEEKLNTSKINFDLYYEKFKNISDNIFKVKVNQVAMLYQNFIQVWVKRLSDERHHFKELFQNFKQSINNRLIKERNRFENLANKCGLLNPFLILERGYSIAYKMPEGELLKDNKQVTAGDEIKVRLHKGEIYSKVIKK